MICILDRRPVKRGASTEPVEFGQDDIHLVNGDSRVERDRVAAIYAIRIPVSNVGAALQANRLAVEFKQRALVVGFAS